LTITSCTPHIDGNDCIGSSAFPSLNPYHRCRYHCFVAARSMLKKKREKNAAQNNLISESSFWNVFWKFVQENSF